MDLNQKQVEANERTNRAFRSLFGTPGNRNEAQRIVKEALEDMGYVFKNSWIPDKSGNMDTHRAAITEGKKLLYLEIYKRANSIAPRNREKSVKTITKDNNDRSED